MLQYTVDVFADRLFEGSPTAVCVLDRWPEERLMCQIASENNLPETAFAVPEGDGYRMRWFAPGDEEISLCGHAALATAYVIMHYLRPELDEVPFQTMRGLLVGRRRGDQVEMSFPAYELKPLEVTEEMEIALGIRPAEVWLGRDLLCVLEREEDVTDEKMLLIPARRA